MRKLILWISNVRMLQVIYYLDDTRTLSDYNIQRRSTLENDMNNMKYSTSSSANGQVGPINAHPSNTLEQKKDPVHVIVPLEEL